jgi:hypothetical protein
MDKIEVDFQLAGHCAVAFQPLLQKIIPSLPRLKGACFGANLALRAVTSKLPAKPNEL